MTRTGTAGRRMPSFCSATAVRDGSSVSCAVIGWPSRARDAWPGVFSPSSLATPALRTSLSARRSSIGVRGPDSALPSRSFALGYSARTCAGGSSASMARPEAVVCAGSLAPTSVISRTRPARAPR